jgi:hypothetical protein
MYRARHGLVRARLGLSRAQLRAQRGVYRARIRARLGVSQARSRARDGVSHARDGLAQARTRHQLYRPTQPTPVEALLPWGLVLVGIGVMIGLLISAFVVPTRHTSGLGVPEDLHFARPDPPSSAPSPDGEQQARYVARDVAAIQYSPTPPPPSPSPSPSPSPPPAPAPTTSAPDPDLSGRYQVEESYQDVFVGNVVIANNSYTGRDWTVELAFGPDVGKLNTFWVDGTPQPTMQRSDDRYVFTSTVPVAGRSWVVLKVHFDRSGWAIDPTICTVNGGDCAIGR